MSSKSLGEDPMEKEMVTCSSILAWEIPWTEEPGELQYMGSQRVEHDSAQHSTGLHSLCLKPRLAVCSPLILSQFSSSKKYFGQFHSLMDGVDTWSQF